MLTEKIRQIIIRSGYTRANNPFNVDLYWKANKEKQSAIIIMSQVGQGARSSWGVRNIKRKVCELFRGLEENNILVVIQGRKSFCYIGSKNLVFIERNGFSVKRHSISGTFSDITKLMSLEARASKAEKKTYDKQYYTPINGYGAWAIYLLIAGILYGVYCFGFFHFKKYGISYNTLVVKKEYLRLLTYMFTHASIRHLFGNIMSLYWIGRALGQRRGGLSILAIYFTSGVTGAYASAYFYGALLPNHFTVGASGAIFGLLGAFLVDFIADPNTRGQRFGVFKYVLMVLICSGMSLRVDNACHVGGLLGGIAMAIVLNTIKNIIRNISFIYTSRRARYLRRAATALSLALVTLSIAGCGSKKDDASESKIEDVQELDQEDQEDDGNEDEAESDIDDESESNAPTSAVYNVVTDQKKPKVKESDLTGTEYGELEDVLLKIIDDAKESPEEEVIGDLPESEEENVKKDELVEKVKNSDKTADGTDDTKNADKTDKTNKKEGN